MKFTSRLEPSSGMYVVLSDDGEQRIPTGRSHASRILAEQLAAFMSRDWDALRFAGVELPGAASKQDAIAVGEELHRTATKAIESPTGRMADPRYVPPEVINYPPVGREKFGVWGAKPAEQKPAETSDIGVPPEVLDAFKRAIKDHVGMHLNDGMPTDLYLRQMNGIQKNFLANCLYGKESEARKVFGRIVRDALRACDLQESPVSAIPTRADWGGSAPTRTNMENSRNYRATRAAAEKVMAMSSSSIANVIADFKNAQNEAMKQIPIELFNKFDD